MPTRNYDELLPELSRDEQSAFDYALKKGLFAPTISCTDHSKDCLTICKRPGVRIFPGIIVAPKGKRPWISVK